MSEQETDPNKDPIRRLTNQQLWDNLLIGTMSEFSPSKIENELVRRLRKIAFLPAPAAKEDA